MSLLQEEEGRLNYRRRGSMSPSPLPINTSSPLIPSSNTTYYTDEEEQEDTGKFFKYQTYLYTKRAWEPKAI